jgi:peptidoglycan/LPS O-acetylase OafA/YrhL
VWLDPNEDYSTMLTESRIMGSLVQYPGELIFLGSVIFVTMMVSMFGRDFAEQAHEYATQHDPNMLGLAVGLILMIVSTFVVGRMDSRRTATVAQAAGWAAFAVGFYGPWAASGFRTGLLAFLLILAMVIWMIAKNARFGRRK